MVGFINKCYAGQDVSEKGATPSTGGGVGAKNDELLDAAVKLRIKIDNNTIQAATVAEFYNKVLKFLCDNDKLNKQNVPFETSAKRYLIATEPYHQRNNEFVVPVEYKGYYMEAHKSHSNAMSSLVNFLEANDINYPDK